jgi:hypothetical protein
MVDLRLNRWVLERSCLMKSISNMVHECAIWNSVLCRAGLINIHRATMSVLAVQKRPFITAAGSNVFRKNGPACKLHAILQRLWGRRTGVPSAEKLGKDIPGTKRAVSFLPTAAYVYGKKRRKC